MSKSLLYQAPFVLLDDSRRDKDKGRTFLFQDPQEIIIARSLCEIGPALERLDKVTAEGLHAAGWISYEAAGHFESRLAAHLMHPREPYIWFMICKKRQSLTDIELKELFFSAEGGSRRSASLSFEEDTDEQERYIQGVGEVLEAIGRGDVYQVNLTFERQGKLKGNPVALYRRLRAQQPVRYGALIHTGELWALSFSPELFFSRQGNLLTTEPMKGTAPRGLDNAEDQAQSQALQEDSKTQAENLMIVDLIRNDLSKIATKSSLSVPELFRTQKLPTLWQMTSRIIADIPPQTTPTDVLRALFPCGSVTGAPKLAAMAKISELEKKPRGIYCGAIGHFSGASDWTMNVPIRTLTLSPNTDAKIHNISLHVGAGLVADSNPQSEYEECRLKAEFAAKDTPSSFALIETMLLDPTHCEGPIPHLGDHLTRLEASAHYFGFSCQIPNIHHALSQMAESAHQPAKLRLLLSQDGRFVLEHGPLPKMPERVCVGLAVPTVQSKDLFLRHKTTIRPLYNKALATARQHGLFDLLFFNEHGALCESSIANVIIKEGGRFITPPLDCGLLPGIARAHHIKTGNLYEELIDFQRLKCADTVYLCNSVRGLFPVEVLFERYAL